MPIKSIILDIDETLIHGQLKKNGDVTIKIRPHCQEFIAYILKNYNVGIWTHANIPWCDSVIHSIFTPEQQKRLCFIYTSVNGCRRKDSTPIKCLEKIFSSDKYKTRFKATNTLIIDDTEHNMTEDKDNGIIIPRFTTNKNDDALEKLISHLEKHKHKTAGNFPKDIEW